jgi:hypothetical protein
MLHLPDCRRLGRPSNSHGSRCQGYREEWIEHDFHLDELQALACCTCQAARGWADAVTAMAAVCVTHHRGQQMYKHGGLCNIHQYTEKGSAILMSRHAFVWVLILGPVGWPCVDLEPNGGNIARWHADFQKAQDFSN